MSSGADAKELFLDALELEGDARARFLAALAEREPELAARVEGLLAAHEGRAARRLESLGGSMRNLLHDAASVGKAGAIVGDYELLEEIASGASGVVWRARQRSLDRVVALKVLRAGRLAGSREVERFRAEAETVARFHHPGIVPVYEVGEHEGRHFFSMRLYQGGSLADRISDGAPWEAQTAVEMTREIALAVHHAHQRGLLHRDLKPSNVLLDERGAPAVADFGVAANIDEAGIAAVTTTLAGTPAYMAPEQTGGGAGAGELTVTTDVWALGCILYELLTGRPPFDADSLSGMLAKVRGEEPLPLRSLAPDTPRDVETIVLRCLAKEPARRYASANALAIDLGRWLAHEPILARRTGPLERFALAWRRNPVVASLAMLVVLLLAALAVGATWAQVKLEARLRDSYLGEARATRLSDETGRRSRALALLVKAAELRPGPDVRDEAIACLATTDLAPLARIPFEPWTMGPSSVDAAVERIAYAPTAGGIVVESLADGRELARIDDGTCDGLLLSRDGSRLVARYLAPEDTGREPGARELRVHSLPDGEIVLRADVGWSSDAAVFDAESRILALGDASGMIRAWDVATGEPLLELDVGAPVYSLEFDEDARTVFAAVLGEDDSEIQRRAFPSGELLASTRVPGSAFAVAVKSEGELVVASSNFDAFVIDAPTPEPESAANARNAGGLEGEEGDERTPPRLLLTGHRAEVTEVAASPASPLALTSSWDGTMQLWDLKSGETLLRVPGQVLGFSTDGRRVAYRTIDSFEIAELVHGGVLTTLHGHAYKSPADATFSRDGERLFSFGVDGAFAWDLASGRAIGRMTDTKTDGIEAAPDGETLYVSSSRGFERRSAAAPLEPGTTLLAGDQDHCDLSADGRLLAVRDNLTLQLFDPERPHAVRELEGWPGFEFVAVSARGTYVAGMTWAGPGVTLWRVSDGVVLARLREDRSALGAAFSVDESRLIVGDGLQYEVYSLPDLALERTIDRGLAWRKAPATMAFSEDGELLALGLTLETVGLYDARTLDPVARLEARDASFDGRVAFSPDATRLAITTFTNRVYVWDLARLRAELSDAGIAWR